jgi:hypothetical protein
VAAHLGHDDIGHEELDLPFGALGEAGDDVILRKPYVEQELAAKLRAALRPA